MLLGRRNTVSSNSVNSARRRLLNPFDWPVARRLFAVIVAALLMGLVFGGLRVYDSEGAASQFSRVSQLADLGEQLTVLVNDLQNERDATLLVLTSDNDASVVPLWAQTHQAAAAVQRAAGIGGLPSNIAADLQTVLADISPARISALESALNPSLPPQDEGAVMGNYDADINDMIVLADQVSQGVSQRLPDQRRGSAQRAVPGQGAGVGRAWPDQLLHRGQRPTRAPRPPSSTRTPARTPTARWRRTTSST